ncbi:MAG: tRNA (adenosine(37)-N6)-dimethylallyltransferase MiaA [Chitinophagales bacterium]
MKKYLVTVVGPTAVGKTKVSIQIARHFSTAIISADARQFYKEMNIGTATPSFEELQSVPHYFINQLSVAQDYTAGDFEKEAIATLETLFKTQDVVVLVGGSGLFISALLYGLDVFPEITDAANSELSQLYLSGGIEALQKLLKEKDPDYFAFVDRNNPQRLLRALSVCLSVGKPYSSFRNKNKVKRNFIPIQIGLQIERKTLYRQIDERVDKMMQEGLLEEVKTLLPYEHLNPLQTVGYRELFSYLDGRSSLEDAVNLIKQHTRNYAKRQLTWFRKENGITWFTPAQLEEILLFINEKINSPVKYGA